MLRPPRGRSNGHGRSACWSTSTGTPFEAGTSGPHGHPAAPEKDVGDDEHIRHPHDAAQGQANNRKYQVGRPAAQAVLTADDSDVLADEGAHDPSLRRESLTSTGVQNSDGGRSYFVNPADTGVYEAYPLVGGR